MHSHAATRALMPMSARLTDSGCRVTSMFIEVIGDRPLPDDTDRDDVEDLLVAVLGGRGEVTGAGIGMGRWHLDVEVSAGSDQLTRVLRDLAIALVNQDLDWLVLRPEGEAAGQPARLLV